MIQKQPALDEVKGAIINMGSEIAESSAKVVDSIKNEVDKAASNGDVKKVIEAAQEKIEGVAAGVEGSFNQVGNELKQIFDFIKDKKNDLTGNSLSLDEMKQVIVNMGGEIADSSSQVFEKIKEQVMNAKSVEKIEKIVAAAQEKIDEAAAEVAGGLNHVANKLGEIRDSYDNQKIAWRIVQKFGQIVQSFLVQLVKIFGKIVRIF